MPTDPILKLDELRFGWESDHNLINIDEFSIAQGESVFLRGPSGSGKSTLLGLVGGVIVPDSGRIVIKGDNLPELSPARRDRVRADHLGIIFQQFNLLPYLSVLDNITLPCWFSKVRHGRSQQTYGSPKDEATELVERLGLSQEDLNKPINKLSVGQQQRAAVARALIGGPSLIIADEPTSALDTDNRDSFIQLLNEQRQRFDTSLLFVSHDRALAKHFDREEVLSELNQSSTSVAHA